MKSWIDVVGFCGVLLLVFGLVAACEAHHHNYHHVNHNHNRTGETNGTNVSPNHCPIPMQYSSNNAVPHDVHKTTGPRTAIS